ncbi:hypothetical protein KY290_021367 [Solanum tuberosum]|uniref:Uncharacterized protein n=1 Tax=Solanum tuberosum TaxID=4113 RepID=A0ABQ7V1C6_SOLTU|nr:hypothetical protein KY285_020292 [Solanum tuberosum]KAH0757874.1 hypothetical protein KY290_021367 [Solanum tuberosum]
MTTVTESKLNNQNVSKCFPMEVPQLISSTLQKLIIMCLTGEDDHDPSMEAVKASTSALLARILVMNTNYLAQLTSDPSLSIHLQKSGFPGEENILLCLVDMWLGKESEMDLIKNEELATKLSHALESSEQSAELELSDSDVREFIKFMLPLRCAIENQEAFGSRVSFPSLMQGEAGNERFEIEGVHRIFCDLLKILELCLKKLESQLGLVNKEKG